MMNYVFLPFLQILIFAVHPLETFAQETIASVSGKDNAISIYRTVVRENSPLYKGKVYKGVNKPIMGHQFFKIPDWEMGEVVYKGNLYKDVPLLYDLLRDELIIQHPNGFLKIQVLKKDIESFTISNNTFKNFHSPLENLASLGICELIYDSDISVLVKRKKRINEKIQEMKVERKFEQENHFYILKDGSFHLVKGKAQALKVLKDKKKVIQKGLRENRIKFRKDPENAIVKMVEFYQAAKE